jgi:hypothetical protein
MGRGRVSQDLLDAVRKMTRQLHAEIEVAADRAMVAGVAFERFSTFSYTTEPFRLSLAVDGQAVFDAAYRPRSGEPLIYDLHTTWLSSTFH